MTIEIWQSCDKCGVNREIQIDGRGILTTIDNEEQKDGWRKVRVNKHLCGECINEAVGSRPPTPD